MENRRILILGAFLMIIVVSESGVVSRNVPRDGPSGNGELPRAFYRGQDKQWRPFGIGEDFGSNEFETEIINPHVFPAYDREDDNRINELKSERVPSDEDRDDDKDVPKDDVDEEDGKPEDEGFLETSDGEEDSDESMDNDKDSAPLAEEDEEEKPKDEDEGDGKIPKENDDSPGEEPEKKDDDDDQKDEDGGDGKIPKENDDSPGEEPEKNDDDDDQKEDEPVDEEDKDNKDIGGGWGSGLFNIFNTPSINFNLIREYSSQLEKAFRQLFRQTADKALRMNGTFTNTTEEEVEIGGKKYIVQKSIIKGGDNDSSIYIETLSSKNKRNETEGIQDNIMGNIERQM